MPIRQTPVVLPDGTPGVAWQRCTIDEWSRLGLSAFDGKPAEFTSDPTKTLLRRSFFYSSSSCDALAAFAEHVELQQQAGDDTGHGDG